MIDSEITHEDRNYWDPLHFSTEVASRLARLIGEGVAGAGVPSRAFTRLYPPAAPS
jgi:hypothetical protein